MTGFIKTLINSKWHRNIYIYAIYASYVLIIIAFTGFFYISPKYLTTLEDWIKYYVIAFLLLRFNPWISNIKDRRENAEVDRKIAFSAGIFLLLTTAATDVAMNSLSHIGIPINNI